MNQSPSQKNPVHPVDPAQSPLVTVGLTGGIACGKTHVHEEFERLGAATLDADQLARQTVEPGQPAFRRIVDAFGDQILTPDGEIDRKKLGGIVFGDEKARQTLNSIVHPEVGRLQDEWLESLRSRSSVERPAMAVIDAALMIEVGRYTQFDVLVVVHCSPQEQLKRLMKRDGISQQQAQQRIDSQMPVSEKMGYADYLIDSSGPYEETRQQVRRVYEKLLGRL